MDSHVKLGKTKDTNVVESTGRKEVTQEKREQWKNRFMQIPWNTSFEGRPGRAGVPKTETEGTLENPLETPTLVGSES